MITTILLTGGGGFVAGNIIAQAGGEVTLQAIEQAPVSLNKSNLTWHILDLRDSTAVRSVFEVVKPDVAIHTAALSDIDYCESHQDIAESVNVGSTRTLVELCAEANTRLICFSSDSVFNGKKGGYVEKDPPDPVHYYGWTKVEAERIVQGDCTNWVLVRPSLIMGLPVLEAGNSFLWRMIRTLKEDRKVAFPKEEIRSPVDVITLSRAILELAGNDFRGILHISGNDTLTRFEMAQRIVKRLGYPVESVIDSKPTVENGRAERPRDVSLNNSIAKAILSTPMLGLDAALDLIIANKGDKVL